jgi:hypothetical protein
LTAEAEIWIVFSGAAWAKHGYFHQIIPYDSGIGKFSSKSCQRMIPYLIWLRPFHSLFAYCSWKRAATTAELMR